VSARKEIPVNIEKLFGEELQKIRKEKGLSQEQLGFESGHLTPDSGGYAGLFLNPKRPWNRPILIRSAHEFAGRLPL
jgi:hypothetical protein